MLIKHGDGKIITIVKTDEELEQAKKLAKQAKEQVELKSKENN